jgi:RNA polymerase sigma-70 factor (ECF subfamily)
LDEAGPLSGLESGGREKAFGAGTFSALVERHWPAVCRLLLGLTGHAHDTEDLAQETFLRAWKTRDSFRPGSNERAWLLRIASNAFFDLRRRQQRRPVEPLADEPAATDRHPAARLEAAEQAELLRAAMAELTEVTRLVFHLRAVEELSFREIGEIADVTEEAARWHMGQARRKLLVRLGKFQVRASERVSPRSESEI